MRVTDPILPAGTVEFDPFSEVFFNDPFNTYRRLRDEAPVYHNEKYGFWALSRYEDVEPALKDFETYSSARGITLDMYLADPEPNQIPMIIMMDPPEHTVMRKLVNKVFTPRAVQALEPMIRATITEVANTLDPTAFDVVEDFFACAWGSPSASDATSTPAERRPVTVFRCLATRYAYVLKPDTSEGTPKPLTTPPASPHRGCGDPTRPAPRDQWAC